MLSITMKLDISIRLALLSINNHLSPHEKSIIKKIKKGNTNKYGGIRVRPIYKKPKKSHT